ncbi:alpha/beta fold hydrolase [Actibacterium ureilyticum]|uniref:alpha/beta fold hydrolase n=1 Tax=Actibacterium ureilyticum TaxID=1590614 RepID=UPI000BAAED7B|nr:alpha/beta hydrolase [Actibacterium ureilyticum]
METAPLYSDLADGPDDGAAFWLRAQDGVRIRIGVWGTGDRGTVLLFPGRTEYIEKYGRAARDLRQRGFATVAIDWRGQGLADRLLPDPAVGHVGAFADYQLDVAAVMAARPGLALPQPLFLIGHSMGGCIGLRAAMNGLPVRAVSFSGPMWGIRMHPATRPAAWALTCAARVLGMGARYVPGTTGQDSYVATAPFDGNELTTDPEMFAYMRGHLAARPELALGGPSLHWVNEALREMKALERLRSPALPCLTALGTDETIVSPAAIHRRMARWPGGTLDLIDTARHEVMMEAPAIRARYFDAVAALFGDAPAIPHQAVSA